MRFGLFGSASARRGGAEFDSSEGFRDFIEYNVEAEAFGLQCEIHMTLYAMLELRKEKRANKKAAKREAKDAKRDKDIPEQGAEPGTDVDSDSGLLDALDH